MAHTVGMDKNGGPNQLKAWREFNKLSQQELADAVGATVGMISMLESGGRGLSAKWLRKLAPILKTRPGHILDTNPADLDNDVVEIWTRINLDDRPAALRVLKSLTSSNGS